ncbi:MAG: molybdenum cofactor guanylyltransferase [Acidimicrobiales bacterium]
MTAAVVVAGGSSRRMGGVDKLALDVGGRPLLDRVLAAARPVCRALVVVGPVRPTSVAGVSFTNEAPAEAGGGPVPAVAAGLDALAGSGAMAVEGTVLVLAGDLPLLAPRHLRRLVATMGDGPAAAAVDDRGRAHPLVAAYRAGVLRARLAALGPPWAGVAAARLLPSDGGLATVDLGADAVRNVNDADDLARARALLARPGRSLAR